MDAAESALKRVERKPQRLRLDLALLWADAQCLPFPDGSFAVAFATFVCCSVTDCFLWLKEAYRVPKEGRLGLLEHQRSPNRMPGQVFDRLPLAVRFSGANIDRRTDVKA